MIEAVFFDLDGTLYDRDALVAGLLDEQFTVFERELAGLSRERFLREALAMDAHGHGEKEEGYARLTREWGLDARLAGRLIEHFWSRYDAHCLLSDDVRATLEALRRGGKKLGVITNGYSAERQRRKLAALGLAESFDVVLVSAEEGVRKPDAEIFRRALARGAVAPSRAVFVGDHPEADVEGASNAGLVAIWKFVPYWETIRPGVPTVRNLAEILPLCLG
jgi:putative hydrolase of the HAD superfamily